MSQFLESLGSSDYDLVMGAMTPRAFDRGEVVFHQGDEGHSLHIVSRGHFIVQALTRRGDETALVVLGPGAVFGELSVVGDEMVRSATIRAIERSATLILSRDAVDDLRRRSKEVDRLLIDLMAATVRRLTDRVVETSKYSAPERVLRRLVELLAVYPSGAIRMSQKAVAELCATSRATVNQTLANLQDQGVIVQEPRCIRVIDADALRALAPEL